MRSKLAEDPERIERKRLNQMEYDKQLALQRELEQHDKTNNNKTIHSLISLKNWYNACDS